MFDVAQPALVVPISPGMGGSSATQVIASSGAIGANTPGTAVLPAAAGKITYITGFDIAGGGATAASVIAVTVSDGTWTMTYEVGVVAGVNAPAFGVSILTVNFSPSVAGSAKNTAITVTLPALGAGSTNASVNARGFQQ